MIRMNRAAAVVALALAAAGVSRLSAQSGYDLFQKALAVERADGNIGEAIKLYERITKEFPSDHQLMAKALLELGACYEKLGDAQARVMYERLVRDYGDQKDAVAIARSRLGSATDVLTRAKGDRAVWTGPSVDSFGRASTDGRMISFVDWNDGRLMLHDVASSVDRALTPAAPGYSQQAEWSVVSRDGKQVAYDWVLAGGGEFRIAAIPGSGFIQPRKLNGDYFTSMDWSPDGKSIAAVKWLKDRTGQIGVISTADGSFRGLKWIPGNALATARNLTTLAFSPDGHYIAYDVPAEGSQQHDIYVLAADGSREVPAVVHSANDVVIGWSPDGTRLLFSSDRTGTVGLWAQPFGKGTLQGAPELLKADIGAGFSLGVTSGGTLYFHKVVGTRDVVTAPLDLATGRLLTPPVSFTQGFIAGASTPVWSPDGRYLAYSVSCSSGCTAIRTLATGEVRRVGGSMTSARGPQWSPDGRSLVLLGRDAKGRDGVFRIDAQTGEATPVVLGDGLSAFAQWSSDAKKVFFNRNRAFVEHNLETGAERVVTEEFGERYGAISPDGQFLAVAHMDQQTHEATLLAIPVAGGPARVLFRTTRAEALFRPGDGSWLPDSSALLVQKHTGTRWELWLVPASGAETRKLDIDPELWRYGTPDATPGVMQGDVGFSVSPDGRRLAMMKGKTAAEVWALENFLPSPAANRQAAAK